MKKRARSKSMIAHESRWQCMRVSSQTRLTNSHPRFARAEIEKRAIEKVLKKDQFSKDKAQRTQNRRKHFYNTRCHIWKSRKARDGHAREKERRPSRAFRVSQTSAQKLHRRVHLNRPKICSGGGWDGGFDFDTRLLTWGTTQLRV